MRDIPKQRRTPIPRTLPDLWREVRKQFFGSDLESGYGYIYTWLANQFGHFMIGFAGTILMGWLVMFLVWLVSFLVPVGDVDYLWLWPHAGIAVAVLWLLVWICKEWLYDVPSALRNLRFAERQREALLAKSPGKVNRPRRFWPTRSDRRDVGATLREYYLTQPPDKEAPLGERFRHDIVRDSEIDIWFYLSGILTATAMYLAPGHSWVPLLTFLILLGVSARVSESWLWGNLAFDRAELPFVTRFALNGRPPENRQAVFDFAVGPEPEHSSSSETEPKDLSEHLVIIGPPKSGRTTIAVALGVEALLASLPPRDVVVYTTLCKLLDRVAEKQMALRSNDPQDEKSVWPPEEAELLIVDDVGAQGAEKPLLTPEAFERELNNNDVLRDICNGKRVIWVVGDNPRRSERWINALKSAFTKEGSPDFRIMPPVKLHTQIPRREWARPSRQAA